MVEEKVLDGKRTDRRSYLKKLALGALGVGALLSLREVPKASAAAVTTGTTNSSGQIAFWTGASDITGSNHLKWDDTKRNFVAGYSGNSVMSGAEAATIGGGGNSGNTNRVYDDWGTVGGGYGNQAGYDDGFATEQIAATVSGGGNNTASGQKATVGGGGSNTASGSHAAVGGGESNTASGHRATVPGGDNNVAAGDYSFAAGRRANIDASHDGSFLFADQSNFGFNSAALNEFAVRATGGVRFVTAIDGGTGAPTKTTVITSDGRLGAGTSSPNASIHGQTDSTSGVAVKGWATAATGATIGVLGQASSTGGVCVMGSATQPSAKPIVAQGYTGQTANLQEWQDNTGTALSVVDKDGKIGVGTVTPAASVHGSNSTLSGIGVQGESLSGICVFGLAAFRSAIPIVAKGYSGQTANLQEWQNNSGTALSVVDASGKLGIGVASPVRQIHLQGNNAVFRMDRDANSSAFMLVRTAAGDFGTIWKTFYVGVNASGVNNGSFFIGDVGTNVSGPSTVRLAIDNSGNVGVGTESPTDLLDVNSNAIRVRTSKTPASASDTGNAGEICWDSSYFYVCVAANTWKRAALSTW